MKYEKKSETKREHEKNKYEENPEPKKENRKKMHKKNKKCSNKVKNFNSKYDKAPISFSQCVIGVFTSVVSDYLNMKNIIFLLQKCIVW